MSRFDTPEKLQRALGWDRERAAEANERKHLRSYLALQLAAAGLSPPLDDATDSEMTAFSRGMLESLREKTRLLSGYLPPIDQRIEAFLGNYFADSAGNAPLRLPSRSLVLDRHGMARELALPVGGDHFENSLINSYRCFNGVLNNPASDRRTTSGTFHIVEDGLPIPGDKRAVPRSVYAELFRHAMNPPDDLMMLPYSSKTPHPAKTWVSLLLRPTVRPHVPGYCHEKSMEVRFFAPGALVSNLDFVESIFGNAGDPLIAENDAGLDVYHWSGHTGCVILATHLVELTKKELGLPHYDEATERQRADSMCYRDEKEKYNDGAAFKLTCRDASGVVVTLIADNYYGYCKKEVKTQISYAANLMGGVEEEHAGGALAFASYSLGEEFQVNSRRYNQRTFDDVARDYASFIDVKPEGYGVDKTWPSIIYIPEDAQAKLSQRCIRWTRKGVEHRVPLSPENVYIAPSGYKIRLERHPSAPSWRLVGTVGEGVFCHKPCTVSGGGKSEISKSLRDYMLYGPIFVADIDEDFAKLDEIFNRNYQDRWREGYAAKPDYSQQPSRSILTGDRSLGSVIQLLTPAPDYNDAYNAWLETIPDHVYAMALIIKRFTEPEVHRNWRNHFGVDIVNGEPGHELKFGERSLVGTYLRVGLEHSRWRTFKLRQDFLPAAKVQREDDISASVVVPKRRLGPLGPSVAEAMSYKFVENCEFRLFQRPDDAIHRGLDKQTEIDLARSGNFVSNFEPLDAEHAERIVQDVIDFEKFTPPMQQMLTRSVENQSTYVVSSAHPRRMSDGTVTKNPRYLQDRPDMVNSRDTYVAFRGMQLFRSLPGDDPVHVPVGAILCGRRNNPPDQAAGIRSLAVYSPLHYQELPELIMDFVCSLTGKSPSTTGAGSEGALTKGPFNMLQTTADLNTAIVSMILTGLGGFSTAAGHIGPTFEVGHDISLLIPEVFCRMGPDERDPAAMIDAGMLEKLEDFDHRGETIPASRLGYRMTAKFVRTYLARVFDNPAKVFTDEILQPELQDPLSYADGILHIAEAQRKVAQRYFDDGTYHSACPPLRAVLSIMAHGQYEGHDASSPEVRSMFTADALLSSDWYRERLETKQNRDVELWIKAKERIERYLADPVHNDVVEELNLQKRLGYAQRQLDRVSSDRYVEELVGTIGADPLHPSAHSPQQLAQVAAQST
jgi:phosphoenolpyruvate carboxykinase (diphosphate)